MNLRQIERAFELLERLVTAAKDDTYETVEQTLAELTDITLAAIELLAEVKEQA